MRQTATRSAPQAPQLEFPELDDDLDVDDSDLSLAAAEEEESAGPAPASAPRRGGRLWLVLAFACAAAAFGSHLKPEEFAGALAAEPVMEAVPALGGWLRGFGGAVTLSGTWGALLTLGWQMLLAFVAAVGGLALVLLGFSMHGLRFAIENGAGPVALAVLSALSFLVGARRMR